MKKCDTISKLGFDIVHGCQLRCVGCPNSVIRPKVKFISAEDFDLCMKNIDVSRVIEFRLYNYGEPLLHPDLLNVIRQIAKQSFKTERVEISTNAQVLNKEVLTEVIKDNIVNRIAVSCDGDGTSEEYERLRPPAKWSKLVSFLTSVAKIRDKYSSEEKFPLITRTVCTDKKTEEKWTELLKPLGWRPQFRVWKQFSGVTADLPGLKKQLNPPNKSCTYVRARRMRGVLYGRSGHIFVDADARPLYVDYDGTVVPCCAHPRAAVLGNLKQKKYNEILADEKMKLFSKELTINRKNMSVCGKCMEK